MYRFKQKFVILLLMQQFLGDKFQCCFPQKGKQHNHSQKLMQKLKIQKSFKTPLYV